MNNIAEVKKVPQWVKTPLLTQSLDSQDLKKHRALIAFELEIISKKVNRFGWEQDRDTPAYDRLMTDWMNALQNYTLPEIQDACAQWLEKNPKNAPNEFSIKALILKARQSSGFKPQVDIANMTEQTQQISSKPINPERAKAAARIGKELGVNLGANK